MQFFNDAWGFDGSLLFGLTVIGLMIFAFAARSTHPLVITIGALLGIGIAYYLGLFPLWMLLVIAFAIIAIAGHVLFGGRGDDE